MALFVGTYWNKVDRKGRVSVPAPFRQAIAASAFNGIYAFASNRAAAIEATDIDFMNELNERVDHFDLFSSQQDDMAATLFAGAQALACDPEGRVTLPQAFLDYASITDRAGFTGMGKLFQIWEPASLEERLSGAKTRARDNALTVPRPAAGGEGGAGR